MFLSNLSPLLLWLQEYTGEGGGTTEEGAAPGGIFSNPLVPMVAVLAIFWVVMIAVVLVLIPVSFVVARLLGSIAG